MKNIKLFVLMGVLLGGIAFAVYADDASVKKPKPYRLDTCAVCGMKLADMGKPYVFEYKGREIKVCDKGEAADFKKDPAKYLKKMEEAEAKLKK
jgi:YHS domain-containing protein